jgi:hypothetical protein
MKVYCGRVNSSGGARHVVVEDDSLGTRELDPRLDLTNHSPTGLNWGYGGSGPAQTALAILADALGDDQRAVRLHQAFKFRVITDLPMNEPWVLTLPTIMTAVRDLERRA